MMGGGAMTRSGAGRLGCGGSCGGRDAGQRKWNKGARMGPGGVAACGFLHVHC